MEKERPLPWTWELLECWTPISTLRCLLYNPKKATKHHIPSCGGSCLHVVTYPCIHFCRAFRYLTVLWSHFTFALINSLVTQTQVSCEMPKHGCTFKLKVNLVAKNRHKQNNLPAIGLESGNTFKPHDMGSENDKCAINLGRESKKCNHLVHWHNRQVGLTGS